MIAAAAALLDEMASPFNHDAKLMEWEHSGAGQGLKQGAVRQRIGHQDCCLGEKLLRL